MQSRSILFILLEAVAKIVALRATYGGNISRDSKELAMRPSKENSKKCQFCLTFFNND